MKKIALTTALLAVSTSAAFAGPQCTTETDGWIPEDQMKQNIEAQGYSIKKFKKTKGNCYEIYGHDQAKHKVEIYFNPINGDIVKKEMD